MAQKKFNKNDGPLNSYEEHQVERAEKTKNPVVRPILKLKARIAKDPRKFRVYSVLRILVIITLIREIITNNYENAALCVLSLFLFLLPAFFEENMHIEISSGFEIVIYLFIYAAEILGEINDYYTAIPGWDTMLHTINGFLCAAVGFSLVDILNQRNAVQRLSAGYLALVAFCFSMTIGVCWEIIEFTMDYFFLLDMQKDYIVTRIGTVTLDPTHSQVPYIINNITKTVIYTASGKTVTINGGYLDIGIIDTMKDLIVNLIGALTFSIIGYKTIQRREKKQKVGNLQNALTEGLRVRRDDDPPEEDAPAEPAAAGKNAVPKDSAPAGENADPEDHEPAEENANPEGHGLAGENAAPEDREPAEENAAPEDHEPAEENANPEGHGLAEENADPVDHEPAEENADPEGHGLAEENADPEEHGSAKKNTDAKDPAPTGEKADPEQTGRR